ncbi:MAG: hypothetical protein JSV78_12205 [Phycisphaerales bacterium]|nr:MAG: hypothetical protein JSV78_12205 [Phycisphaerales bacterium]
MSQRIVVCCCALGTLLAGPTAWGDVSREETPAVGLVRYADGAEPGGIQVILPERAVIDAEDEERARDGLPPRYAIPHPVFITPDTDGRWEHSAPKVSVWTLRISSPGALSINFGFTRYHMPDDSQLIVRAADGSHSVGPYTEDDNEDHGQLWTPVVLSDDVVVEATVPVGREGELELELTSINAGYRFFGETFGERSGWCNIDVICPEGDPWRDEIASVGVISTGGSTFCSGFMVNNTAQDQTPYFMTAMHCDVTSGAAASLVVYWNFESPSCGQQGGGSLDQNQTGSYWRAEYGPSDFTLLELDENPDPSFGVTFAGWDRGSADPTSAVAIHHPSGDEKSISFEYDPTQTTSYLQETSPGDGTHIEVIDWDLGTTEPVSSGSPLFDPNHHAVGQLHGGDAACGNDEPDWYGRFSVSWTGGGTSSSRLSDWLDPGGTGLMSIDTLVPGITGLEVAPTDGLDSQGDPGGPFTPDSKVYTLTNLSEYGINYEVTHSEAWVSVSNDTGFIPAGDSTAVTVSINSAADSLEGGTYTDYVHFNNTTDGIGNTVRVVTLQVGGPTLIYSFPLDTDPGWATQGDWAFGQPTGGGGTEHGKPDPTSGYTGTNVYGYNLDGDYPANLPERHLTTTALDCTGVIGATLKFARWLNVESSQYDHAYVRVSDNLANWMQIWENPNPDVEDAAWQVFEYDISAVADGESTVYIRWTMGETDGDWQFSGWNIDDIEIWGIPPGPTCDDGILNQGEDRIDCGGPCPPCECTSDGTCDNSLWCDGTETCDAYGFCQPGEEPCGPDEVCNENADVCDPLPFCATIPNPPVCSGDADGNGEVTPSDVGLVKYWYGDTDPVNLCHYDVDCDGEITPADVGLVKYWYGPCTAESAEPCWMPQ